MSRRSPSSTLLLGLFLFGCDNGTNTAVVAQDSVVVSIPSIRPGADTALDIVPNHPKRLLFLPRDSSSYTFFVTGTTPARIALFDTAKFDSIKSLDSLSKAGNRIVWTSTSSNPKWLVLAGQDSTTKGAVLLSASITAGTDDFEPDNSPRHASSISTDSLPQSHFLHARDSDWVRFQTTPYKSYSITLGGNSTGYLQHRVFLDSLATKPFDSGYTQGFLKPGKAMTLFVLIFGYRPASSGSYTVAIAADSTNDRHEPDDSRGSAEWISTDSTPQNRFMQAAEHDWIKFAAVAGRSYRIALDGEAGIHGIKVYTDELTNTPVDSGEETCAYKAAKSGTVFVDLHSPHPSLRGKYSVAVSTDTANDRYENDDLRTQAAWVEIDGTQKRHLQAGEHDWFKFKVDSGKNYRIAADSCPLQLQMSAYPEGEDSAILDSRSIMGMKTAKSGSIFVDLRGADATSADYELSVSVDTTIPDKFEPDDSWNIASDVATDGSPQKRTLQLGEHDWVRFRADSGSSYLFAVAGLPGARIACHLDSIGKRPAMKTTEAGAIVAAHAGTVFLDVSGLYGEISGNYTVSVRKSDAYEPDDSRTAAARISTDSTPQTHQLVGAEHDWIRFEAVKGQSYTIAVQPANSDRLTTAFEIYDDQHPLDRAAASGSSYYGPTTYTATENGTVSIDIHSSNGQSTGAYFVTVKVK